MLLLLSGAAGLSGCAGRKARPLPWATAIQVRPILPATATAGNAAAGDQAPDLTYAAPTSNTRALPTRSGPARPRVLTSQGGEVSANEKPEAPLIAPELSLEEAAEAERQTNQSLAEAQRGLDAVRGRTLRASELDLVSKVRGFMSEAKDAVRAGDWTRARNLAQKAQVLAQQVAGLR